MFSTSAPPVEHRGSNLALKLGRELAPLRPIADHRRRQAWPQAAGLGLFMSACQHAYEQHARTDGGSGNSLSFRFLLAQAVLFIRELQRPKLLCRRLRHLGRVALGARPGTETSRSALVPNRAAPTNRAALLKGTRPGVHADGCWRITIRRPTTVAWCIRPKTRESEIRLPQLHSSRLAEALSLT